jgi:hypothetical protein
MEKKTQERKISAQETKVANKPVKLSAAPMGTIQHVRSENCLVHEAKFPFSRVFVLVAQHTGNKTCEQTREVVGSPRPHNTTNVFADLFGV